MNSRWPQGSQFLLSSTRFWVAKRGKGEGQPILIFQREGQDLVAVAEFYSPTVADEFIHAVLNGLAELPPAQLDAITEAGKKVTATQLGLGEQLEAKE